MYLLAFTEFEYDEECPQYRVTYPLAPVGRKPKGECDAAARVVIPSDPDRPHEVMRLEAEPVHLGMSAAVTGVRGQDPAAGSVRPCWYGLVPIGRPLLRRPHRRIPPCLLPHALLIE